MEPRDHKHSPPTTVLISSLAIWASDQINAEHQVNPTPAMVNRRLPMQRTLYDHEGRRHGGHAMLANVRISPVVSRLFRTHNIAH